MASVSGAAERRSGSPKETTRIQMRTQFIGDRRCNFTLPKNLSWYHDSTHFEDDIPMFKDCEVDGRLQHKYFMDVLCVNKITDFPEVLYDVIASRYKVMSQASLPSTTNIHLYISSELAKDEKSFEIFPRYTELEARR